MSVYFEQKDGSKYFFSPIFWDLVILNSNAIYLCKTEKKTTWIQFHLEATCQLLDQNLGPRTGKESGHPSVGGKPIHLIHQHYLSLVPATE